MRTDFQEATFTSDVARLRIVSVWPRVMSAGARANAVTSITSAETRVNAVASMSDVSSTRGAQEHSGMA